MKFKSLPIAALALSLFSTPVFAQDYCGMGTAEVTVLREPQFDAAKHDWTLLYAEDGMDVFSDLVQIDSEHFVAAGSYTKDKEDEVYHPLLVKYDARFKPVWTVREDSAELKTIHRIIKTKEGFTVVGDINDKAKGNGIYLGSYNEDGSVRGKPVAFFEAGGNLDVKAFVASQDAKGYIIAAQYIDAKDSEKQIGYLYKVSKSGALIWKRSFTTGRTTVFNNIQTGLDGNYMVTGQMVMEGNISGAWFLRLNEDGAVMWQRTYPRGIAATFLSASQTKSGDFILAGKARPVDYDGQGLAAWVMKTDSSGNPLWQRYLKGPYSFEAADLIVYEDGRASVLLNAEAMNSELRSHARLATFSPQGELQHLEEFTDGQNATAARLVAGLSGERIIVGHAQTSFGDNQEANHASAAPIYTYDGWLLAGSALDNFTDPCAKTPTISPILP